MNIAPISPPASGLPANRAGLKDGLEKAFLSEMLKYSGPKPLSGGFGGGIGEDQFASMLTDIHASALASRMDLGLIRGSKA